MKSEKIIKESFMFSKVFKHGKYAANNLLVLYALKNYNKKAASKLGISVSAKNGGAVRRNRAKRVIREAFSRLYKDLPQGYLFVIVGRKPCFDRDTKMSDVLDAAKSALSRIKL